MAIKLNNQASSRVELTTTEGTSEAYQVKLNSTVVWSKAITLKIGEYNANSAITTSTSATSNSEPDPSQNAGSRIDLVNAWNGTGRAYWGDSITITPSIIEDDPGYDYSLSSFYIDATGPEYISRIYTWYPSPTTDPNPKYNGTITYTPGSYEYDSLTITAITTKTIKTGSTIFRLSSLGYAPVYCDITDHNGTVHTLSCSYIDGTEVSYTDHRTYYDTSSCIFYFNIPNIVYVDGSWRNSANLKSGRYTSRVGTSHSISGHFNFNVSSIGGYIEIPLSLPAAPTGNEVTLSNWSSMVNSVGASVSDYSLTVTNVSLSNNRLLYKTRGASGTADIILKVPVRFSLNVYY